MERRKLLVSVFGLAFLGFFPVWAQGPPLPPNFTRRIPPALLPNGPSLNPKITPDGRFIVFQTAADVGLGSNGFSQIYRAECGINNIVDIIRVSVDQGGGCYQQLRERIDLG